MATHPIAGVPPCPKVGLSELEFNRSEFALQDSDKEIPAAARRFQEARVKPLGLALNEVKHRIDHPRGCEHLAVVCYSFF